MQLQNSLQNPNIAGKLDFSLLVLHVPIPQIKGLQGSYIFIACVSYANSYFYATVCQAIFKSIKTLLEPKQDFIDSQTHTTVLTEIKSIKEKLHFNVFLM